MEAPPRGSHGEAFGPWQHRDAADPPEAGRVTTGGADHRAVLVVFAHVDLGATDDRICDQGGCGLMYTGLPNLHFP